MASWGIEDTYLTAQRQRLLPIIATAVILGITLLVSLGIGAVGLSIRDIWEALIAGPRAQGVNAAVIWTLRAPRILIAAAVGGALAASGAAFQASYRNPLVDPSILGVSAGAAFGAGVTVVLPVAVPLPLAAFVGGVMAVSATYVVSSVNGSRPAVTIILAGVVVGGIFTAGFGLLQYIGTSEQLRRLVFWLLGGFYEATWTDVAVVVPAIVILIITLATHGWRLNVLGMGDADALALGLDPDAIRRRILVLATALTAAAVAVSGVVAWIGLLMPHAARFVVGSDNRRVVPLAALLGAVFAVIADDLSRTISTGEIPIGILTSLLGAPFLLYLLRTRAQALMGT